MSHGIGELLRENARRYGDTAAYVADGQTVTHAELLERATRVMPGLQRDRHRSETPRDRERLRSVGYPFPGTDVRIVDDAGHDVGAGPPGEIVVRSPGVARGYWNNSVAPVETFRDGWCRNGDIGAFDDEGLLHLVDRKKDIIITGGENVASVEVEDVVVTHPAVAECAVVGVADPTWGEAITAVIVLVPGQTVELTQIRNSSANVLPATKPLGTS